jgi:hypothetical protein
MSLVTCLTLFFTGKCHRNIGEKFFANFWKVTITITIA